jgi:hypothetical protein
MNPTIREFCKQHGACIEGQKWALEQGVTTMAELWSLGIKPEWRVWIATRPGVLSDRELRLFACWCVRQVWHLLTDERSRKAVEVSERYARGEATDSELSTARDAAWNAAWDAAWNAAWDAAWAAVRAAQADARAAAQAAAQAAARATLDTDYDAAHAAARKAQAEYLIDLGNPFIDDVSD